MTRGQDGSLRPSCVTLAFTTPRRFIPAHPPSTSSPCPAWFFRLLRPFFCRSETAVQKRFAPLQLLALVQLAQKRPPDVQPNAPLLPISQPPPARRRMREFLRQVLPASPAPQNPFQHTTVLNPG